MKCAYSILLAFTTAGLTGRAAESDAAPALLTPDFTSIVAKGGGLWSQIQCAPDGTLLAFGYNAAAHTTLPADIGRFTTFAVKKSGDGSLRLSVGEDAKPTPSTL